MPASANGVMSEAKTPTVENGMGASQLEAAPVTLPANAIGHDGLIAQDRKLVSRPGDRQKAGSRSPGWDGIIGVESADGNDSGQQAEVMRSHVSYTSLNGGGYCTRQ